MFATDLIRQAQSSVEQARQASSNREKSNENDERQSKNTYTLTACCRCRQRKTKCDPSIPRCLPCQRGGAVCEYYDRIRNKNIPRSYVLHLQENIRALEKELSQYMEVEVSPQNTEDMVRPGGFVRLNPDDETPRFLGPSSGIAMTRLVMEEAKKYTDSRSIRELVPDLHDRVNARNKPYPGRKKSYPRISVLPATILPSRLVAEKLVEIFNQKAQYFTPTLHEPTFVNDMQDVYDGSSDPYQNFVLRLVFAISLQKLNLAYAGLADSYYVAAMNFFEGVIRPKDLKTLQCLVLVAQYSLLTPTQTAIYYIVGLATRLCQQLGLTEEKTIVQGVSLGLVDSIQLDMRRRLAWIILSMEYGLAHSMGRPNSFASGQDHIDLEFFEPKDDEYITAKGILSGPLSEKKMVAIHFLKMRLLQAEIRRVLYQLKRPEPQDEDHPWFKEIQQKMKDWFEASPHSPSWSRPWFYGRYQTMIVMLFRPSPQVPQPMIRSAIMCYDAAAINIKNIDEQMNTAMVDITWIFVLTIFQALNTILWTTSYAEIREIHSKQEVERLVKIALEAILWCRDRWPGTSAAAQLYSKLSQACLRSYGHNKSAEHLLKDKIFLFDSPSISVTNSNPPAVPEKSPAISDKNDAILHLSDPFVDHTQKNSSDEAFESNLPNPCINFWSNSTYDISPLQVDPRFSYFPPENMQSTVLTENYHHTTNGSQILKHDVQHYPVIDPSYSLYPSSYSFCGSMYADQNLDTEMQSESLSQEQQIELMENLEMNGLDEMNHFMNLSPCHE